MKRLPLQLQCVRPACPCAPVCRCTMPLCRASAPCLQYNEVVGKAVRFDTTPLPPNPSAIEMDPLGGQLLERAKKHMGHIGAQQFWDQYPAPRLWKAGGVWGANTASPCVADIASREPRRGYAPDIAFLCSAPVEWLCSPPQDPRLVYTLHLWQEMWLQRGESLPLVIHVRRNREAVVRSYKKDWPAAWERWPHARKRTIDYPLWLRLGRSALAPPGRGSPQR